MNKQEFTVHIAELHNITITSAHTLIDTFTESVTAALAGGDPVNLVGFGSFESKAVPERPGRNPKTGEIITIAARNAPTFKAGKGLKEAVN